MKLNALTALLLLCSLQTVAQQYQIVDEHDGTPIPYANIFYPELRTGIACDSMGKFQLIHLQKDLSVQVSAIGFQSVVLHRSELPEESRIALHEAHMEVQEVLVSAPSAKLSGESAMNIIGVNLNSDHADGAPSLTEKLSSIPGLSNTATGTGIGKPTIRGLSGNRVAVFSQGVRVENQQWGDEHGLGLDANGYQHVEVIKGPASLLHGSDALGGVLYFVDGRFADYNSLEAGVQTQFSSNTLGLQNSAYFKLSKGRFHWNVFGAHRNHKDYQDGDKQFVPNSRFNTTDLKSTLGYISEKWSTSLRYNFLRENYGLTESDASETRSAESGFSGPFQVLRTHIASMENTFFLPKSTLRLNVGFVHNQRQEFEDGEPALDMKLNTLSYNGKWKKSLAGSKWDVIIGSQGMYQWNKNQGTELLIPDATTIDLGLFSVVNFNYSKESFWQLGVRYDMRNLASSETGPVGDDDYRAALMRTFHAFNFASGIKQKLLKDFSLRFTVASGFRSPNSFELLTNGEHHGAFRYEIGDRNLRSENAYQLDLALNYNGEHFEIFVNPFFNYVRNFIYLNPSDSTLDGLPVYHFTQNDAMLYGGEAGWHIHPHPLDWLHLRSSYSNVFGQLAKGENLPLIPAQKLTTNIRADFSFKSVLKNLGLYFQHDYNFVQNNLGHDEIRTPDYHLLSAGIELEFKLRNQSVFLDLSATNLTNATYFSHLSRYKTEGIYNMGRNFTVSLRIPFKHDLK